MSGVTLDGMISAWLNRAGRKPSVKFPAPLERLFEQDTGAARSSSLFRSSLLGVAVSILLFVAICNALPDVATVGRIFFFGMAMPVSLGIAAIVRLNPRPVLREGLTAFANLVVVAVAIGIFTSSHAPYAPYFYSGVSILLIYSAIVEQLRFGYATFTTIVIVAGYAAALAIHTDVPAAIQRDLVLVAAATGAYLLIANWRLERELRRNYLVSLRERLQRDDLSLRNRELDEMARCDALTGLANRRAYDAWMQVVWQQARTRGGRVGLVVVDIDYFKDYNDFYGHIEGDRCLQAVARCLRDQLRGTSDLVARLGGEEFTILLPALDPDLCADVAERIRRAVEAMELPHLGRAVPALVTVSAGVASLLAEPASIPASLFAAADAALYEAKQTGRNRVCVAAGKPLGVTAPAVNG